MPKIKKSKKIVHINDEEKEWHEISTSKIPKVNSKKDFIPQGFSHIEGIKDQDWTQVEFPISLFKNNDIDGLISIEEIDGYDIESVSDVSKNVLKVKKIEIKDKLKKKKIKNKFKNISITDHPNVQENKDSIDDFIFDLNQKWLDLGLENTILKSLQKLSFKTPTEIQNKTIGPALLGRDIIGCAQTVTGSGKTLAFGIPILHKLIESSKQSPKSIRKIRALIVVPTRELAVQVSDHLKSLAQFTLFKISHIVGGLSIQKQHRIISDQPDILVATPGRLWDLIQNMDHLAENLNQLEFFVVDEADRLLQSGRFKELKEIIKTISPDKKNKTNTQTFIFSATLSQTKSANSNSASLDEIISSINFRDKKPLFIDLAPTNKVADKLIERKITCVLKDKDVYLFYLLSVYKLRTIVFVNSIDMIRRLTPLLALLGIQAWPLHAHMQQKQRLKNVERFSKTPSAALITTDVASRGIDIKNIELVVHFQVPRESNIYIHRSGRTARASSDGLSIVLVSPEEFSNFKKLCHDLPLFYVQRASFQKLSNCVNLAKKIEEVEHINKKVKNKNNWTKKMADDLDIELDESDDSDKNFNSKIEHKNKQGLKNSLSIMLKNLNIRKETFDSSIYDLNVSSIYDDAKKI